MCCAYMRINVEVEVTGRLVKHNIMAIWGKTLSKQIILSKLTLIHLIIFIFLPDFNKYSLVETEGSTILDSC